MVCCFYCITFFVVSSATADQLGFQPNESKNENLIEPEIIVDFVCLPVDEPKVVPEKEPPPPEPIIVDKKVDDGRIEVNFKISFYTSLACENTKYGAVDAMGNSLKYGTIAVPKNIPLKSKFHIDDEEFVARDRGGKIKWIDENTMKIDIFIPRKKGESDSQYYKRVNNMGIQSAKGYYIPYQEGDK